ncbi:MAG: C1 family peptidase [Candidatus Nanoarchaeia archaeon]|jgi:C1A family cysteine protease
MKITKSILIIFIILLALPVSIAKEPSNKQGYTKQLNLTFEEELLLINEQIINQNKNWIATNTSIAQLSIDERKNLLSTKPITSLTDGFRAMTLINPDRSLPQITFDWRDINGSNWVTPVRDQASCGSCWAFSAVGAVESRINIALNNPNYDIDLAEQDIVSCYGDGFGCEGGLEVNALNYMKTNGIVKESCFPYLGVNATGLCANKCANWPNELIKVLDYSLLPADVSTIKQAINDYGPITVYMAVFTDFFLYGGGIYSYTWGSLNGYHAVIIVGYNDTAGYWICKNSWGTDWGENGFFKISYDENVLDFGEWYYNPYDYRTFFLDMSYVVTSTDIDNDGVSDETDLCPTTWGVPANNGCYPLDVELINPPWFATGIINLSWVTSTINAELINVSINYTLPKEPSVIIAQGLPPNSSYLWNTTNINTDELNLTLKADDGTNTKTITYVNLMIDNTKPIITNTTINNSLFNQEQINLNFTASDNLADQLFCSLFVDDNQVNTIITNNHDPTNINASLTNGYHDWYINCYDMVGLWNTSPINTLLIDSTPPEIIINNPLNIFYPNNPGSFNITIIDLSNVTNAYVKVFDSDNNLIDNFNLTQSGDYWYNDTYDYPLNKIMTFESHALDSLNNEAINYSYLLIDTETPSLELNAPISDTHSKNTTYFLSFWSNDTALSTLNCSLLINDELVTNDYFNNGYNNFTINLYEDGVYNWRVNCSDNLYNNLSNQKTFVRDTTGPELLIYSPNGNFFGPQITINFSAIDALSTVNKLLYEIDFDGFIEFTAPLNISLSNGVHRLYYSAIDSLDNPTNYPIYFSVDNASPIINLNNPQNTTYNTSNVPLIISLSDDSETYCNYSIDNNSPISCANTTIGPFNDLSIHTILINATDEWGSTNSSSTTFSINLNWAPTITTTSDYNISEGDSLSIDFNATDPDNDVLTFSDNSALFDINSITGIINWTAPYTSAGDYLITIIASDGFLSDTTSFNLIINDCSFCGNSVCDSNETCTSCPNDCGACQAPPSPAPINNPGTGVMVAGQSLNEIIDEAIGISENLSSINDELNLINDLINLEGLDDLMINLTNTLSMISNSSINNSTKASLLIQAKLLMNNITNSIPIINVVNETELIINDTSITQELIDSVNNKLNNSMISLNAPIIENKKVITITNKTTNETMTITVINNEFTNNQNESIFNFTLIENVPKSYALLASELNFSDTTHLVIIEDDPIIAWVFDELTPGQTINVGYKVSKDLTNNPDVSSRSIMASQLNINGELNNDPEIINDNVNQVTGYQVMNLNGNSILNTVFKTKSDFYIFITAITILITITLLTKKERRNKG